MLQLDGSQGEGGGQILRSALALSIVTGRPFHIRKIRAGREKPGLRPQHLTAVKSAAEICGGRVAGAAVGSRDLTFEPGDLKPGEYEIDIGTAGSTTLVLQTILPPLLTAAGPSRIVLTGGTHNPFAPPFDFLERSFIPVLNRMGPQIALHLERVGFAPKGRGRMSVDITPAARLTPIELTECGKPVERRVRAVVAGLQRHIAEREIQTACEVLDWPIETGIVEELPADVGPGNVVHVEITCPGVTEVCTSFGSKGVRAEVVAQNAATEAARYLQARVPVGEHLADQLLLPFALAGGGCFLTVAPSLHFETNVDVVQQFLEIDIARREVEEDRWEIELGAKG
jgi:RNA 3'-terminal phosphate cyclase (ATP)